MPDDSPNPPISPEEVLALARLCHLELSADEQGRMTRDLVRILGYVRKLQELDVAAVPATAHVQIESMPLRPDEERPSLARESFLREAPAVSHDGFAVPAFVDEG